MTRFDARQHDIALLNVFLCRERSSFDAYKVCLESVVDPQISQALARLLHSHRERVQALDLHIRALGGTPRAHSSMWRALSRAVEKNAGKLDKRIAIHALEQYSSRTLRAYRNSLGDLSPETRDFIVKRILPERQRTHESVVSLQEAV